MQMRAPCSLAWRTREPLTTICPIDGYCRTVNNIPNQMASFCLGLRRPHELRPAPCYLGFFDGWRGRTPGPPPVFVNKVDAGTFEGRRGGMGAEALSARSPRSSGGDQAPHGPERTETAGSH